MLTKKSWMVLSNTVVNPIDLFTADQKIHNRDDILVTRDNMFIWTYSISCSFCTVFFLYITELCILKAQQIQNIVIEYKYIAKKTYSGILIFYISLICDSFTEICGYSAAPKPPGHYSYHHHYKYYYDNTPFRLLGHN